MYTKISDDIIAYKIFDYYEAPFDHYCFKLHGKVYKFPHVKFHLTMYKKISDDIIVYEIFDYFVSEKLYFKLHGKIYKFPHLKYRNLTILGHNTISKIPDEFEPLRFNDPFKISRMPQYCD